MANAVDLRARKEPSNASLSFPRIAAVAAFALLAVVVSMTFASPPTGVTPTLLARGSYSDFKVASNPDNGGMFKAEAKGPIDVVVRQHDYIDGGSTGWHQHPYPVFITVTSGDTDVLRRQRPDLFADPWCRRVGGYVDSGKGHLGPQRERRPGHRYQRDHGAGRRPVPRRAPRPEPELRLLTRRVSP